jgi:hypothetical protein
VRDLGQLGDARLLEFEFEFIIVYFKLFSLW